MNKYLQKHAIFPRLIEAVPKPKLGISIVIPCFNETSLSPVFKSLNNCQSPNCEWEIIAVVNSAEDAPKPIKTTNQQCEDEALAWITEFGQCRYHVLHMDMLPNKHAGVGLARKIGMDEAVRRVVNDGIIVNLDADCTVASNYLVEIEKHFQKTKADGCSIHFEHPLNACKTDIQAAIVQYELYLRYFINMQKLISFPWAFQTIGSAMAVRADVYQKQGGMNKRKAGEDFYFLQKIIELGNFTELNSTTVFASPRKSDRVPFGTGKAVNDIVNGNGEYLAYHPKSFEMLGQFFALVPSLFGKQPNETNALIAPLHQVVVSYLQHWDFGSKVEQVNKFTKDQKSFTKRFYREFNAFQMMKYCHHVRDHFYPDVQIHDALKYLFRKIGLEFKGDLKEALLELRKYDLNKKPF